MIYKIHTIISLVILYGLTATADAQSLYQDVKAKQIGDVITIVLAENITGSSEADNGARSRNSGSVSGSFNNDFLPVDDFSASTESDNQVDKQASSNQRQLLSGNMSVRIEEIAENGDLFVKGERTTEINGEIHSITLSGYVRPSDVDTQNRVPSFRVADAEIVFQQEGGIAAMKERKGIFKKVLGVVGVVSGLSSLVLLGF